jgi:hypothetical protein
MSMEIIITYETIEDITNVVSDMRTCVEIYTLPIVAVARMDVLSKAGFAPCLTVTRTPIVEVN